MTASLSASDAVTGMWRNEKCAVSIPPSADCAQLHCWSFFDTNRARSWCGLFLGTGSAPADR